MMKKNKGFTRVFKAAFYSYKGLAAAIKYEAAFRQEFILAMVFLPLAFFIDVTQLERVCLIATTLFILIVELLNSAIEAVVDRVGTELHPLSGRAKDMGSAAVFMSLILWFYTWGALVLWPWVKNF